MTDELDEAWHALFHMVDAFEDQPNRTWDDRPKYQREAIAEAERVMALLDSNARMAREL